MRNWPALAGKNDPTIPVRDGRAVDTLRGTSSLSAYLVVGLWDGTPSAAAARDATRTRHPRILGYASALSPHTSSMRRLPD
jgi:predicted butyrate kinase (DUF1464 family)